MKEWNKIMNLRVKPAFRIPTSVNTNINGRTPIYMYDSKVRKQQNTMIALSMNL